MSFDQNMSYMPSDVQYDMSESFYSQQFYSYDGNFEMSGDMEFGDSNCLSSRFLDGVFEGNGVRAIKFDPHEEMVWCISNCGHLCGYQEWQLRLAVSVDVPEIGRSPMESQYELLDLLPSARPNRRLLYLLGRREVLVYSKMGGLKKRIEVPQMPEGLSCFSWSPLDDADGGEQLLLGGVDGLVLMDVEYAKSVAVYSQPNQKAPVTALLRYQRGVLASTADGSIGCLDLRCEPSGQFLPDSFRPSHPGGLCDFSVNPQGYTVVSCGSASVPEASSAPQHHRSALPVPDPHLQVYDLRYRKTQCPIRTETEPTFVRFLPVFNDCMLVGSSYSATFQVAHFGQNFLNAPTERAQTASQFDSVSAVDISSNANLMAFGTAEGLISIVSRCPSGTGQGTGVMDTQHRAGDGDHSLVVGGVTGAVRINAVSKTDCSGMPSVAGYMRLPPVKYDDPDFVMSSSEFSTEPCDLGQFQHLSSDWPAHLCGSKYKKFKPIDRSLFTEYPSKFKTELIGRKPPEWGPVWSPY